MGKGGRGSGGGGGGGGGGSAGGFDLGRWLARCRLFRALKISTPRYEHHELLKQVAIRRGLSNVEQLLASLGKQETGMSSIEELDFLTEELGLDTVIKHVLEDYKEGPQRCTRLLNTYLEDVKEYGEDGDVPRSRIYRLRKFCGYSAKDLKEKIKEQNS